MKLRTLLTLVLATILLAGLLVLALVFQSGLRGYSVSTAEQAVHVRTRTLGAFLSRSLFEEWQRVEGAASRLSGDFDAEEATSIISGLEQDIDKVSWIGLADRNGTVLAASRDMLEGENVGQRPWFQQGLAGPFAGDVHEAVLLARLLESSDTEPLRFVDFSAPVKDAQGNVTGVLGAHVNWRWVGQLVEEASELLQLDIYLLNRTGTVILSTASVDGPTSTLPSFRAAHLGIEATGNEVWPDGRTYYTTTVPQFTYGSLPPFGWSMVARLDPAYVEGAETRFRTRMLAGAAGLFVVVLALFAIVTGIILRPLQALAQSLLQQASGEPTPYVREHSRFREAQILSDAAALLQSQSSTVSRPLSDRPSDNAPQ
jgi:hypothetical protein